MGRHRSSKFTHTYTVDLTSEDNLKLEQILIRLRIGGDTKSEKFRLLIRKVWHQLYR